MTPRHPPLRWGPALATPADVAALPVAAISSAQEMGATGVSLVERSDVAPRRVRPAVAHRPAWPGTGGAGHMMKTRSLSPLGYLITRLRPSPLRNRSCTRSYT